MSRRFDQEARKIADRHYSRQKVGAPDFVGNVKPLVLLAPAGEAARALWVSAWQTYVRHEYVNAWQCTLFRNEGAGLSSELITEAVAATRWAWRGMPENGFVTFVDRDKTKAKKNPGYCYLKAGWEEIGRTKGGLVVLKLAPEKMPDPAPAYGAQAKSASGRVAIHSRRRICSLAGRGSSGRCSTQSPRVATLARGKRGGGESAPSYEKPSHISTEAERVQRSTHPHPRVRRWNESRERAAMSHSAEERERLATMLEEDIVNMVANSLGHPREGSYATDLRKAAAILRAPVAPPAAEPMECVFCRKATGMHEHSACQLHDGRWVCSSDCWERAARMWDEPIATPAADGGEAQHHRSLLQPIPSTPRAVDDGEFAWLIHRLDEASVEVRPDPGSGGTCRWVNLTEREQESIRAALTKESK